MVEGVKLFFWIGMGAGMFFTLLLMAVAVVLLTLHCKKYDYYPEDDNEESA